MTTIPKCIYQVWFQGKDKIPKKHLNIHNQWRVLNPDWNVVILDDTDLQNACYRYSAECGEAYSSAKVMHTKIDMGRLVYIYLYGGMYTDIDMLPIRPLDNNRIIKQVLTQEGQVIGLSEFQLNPFEKLFVQVYELIKSGSMQLTYKTFNNALCISSPRNEILKNIIDSYIKNIQHVNSQIQQVKKEVVNIDFDYVQQTTGPQMFNKILRLPIPKNISFYCFPFNQFEPCVGDTSYITDDTVSLHQFEMSWLPRQFK